MPSLKETDRRESFPFLALSEPRIPEEVNVKREETLEDYDREEEKEE